MSVCENFRGIAFTPVKGGLGITRLRCKKWSCPHCAKLNQTQWRVFLGATLPAISPTWTLITFTAHRKWHKNENSLKNIMSGWDRLMKRLKRDFGRFEYVRLYERHASGEFHVHMLCSVNCDPTESDYRLINGKKRYRGRVYVSAKTHAIKCGLGYQIDVSPLVDDDLQPTDTWRAVSYVVKYMGKGLAGDMPKGTRRIQTSRGIGSPKPAPSDMDWVLKSGVYRSDVETDNWFDLNRQKREIVLSDFDDSYIYPPQADDL